MRRHRSLVRPRRRSSKLLSMTDGGPGLRPATAGAPQGCPPGSVAPSAAGPAPAAKPIPAQPAAPAAAPAAHGPRGRAGWRRCRARCRAPGPARATACATLHCRGDPTARKLKRAGAILDEADRLLHRLRVALEAHGRVVMRHLAQPPALRQGGHRLRLHPEDGDRLVGIDHLPHRPAPSGRFPAPPRAPPVRAPSPHAPPRGCPEAAAWHRHRAAAARAAAAAAPSGRHSGSRHSRRARPADAPPASRGPHRATCRRSRAPAAGRSGSSDLHLVKGQRGVGPGRGCGRISGRPLLASKRRE